MEGSRIEASIRQDDTNGEMQGEDQVFGETEEMELAAELLEITDENELDQFLGSLIVRATGSVKKLAASPALRGFLRQAARRALPTIGGTGDLTATDVGTIGGKLAAAAGRLFGLELEGMSPEDQEFEVARRFVRFAGAGARNARRFRSSQSPQWAARQALKVAARRHAPGFLRPRKPGRRRRRVMGVPPSSVDWADDSSRSASPLAVTCRCQCGGAAAASGADPTATPQSAPPPVEPAASDNSTPDSEPADSTDQQPQQTKETAMHDLDRTTLEINDEAGDFEFQESPPESASRNIEGPFSEEDEAELAAELLEIREDAELDQFIGGLLKKARRVVGGALKSPLLRPLGGFLKGAIKKALPIAGGALGNLVAPGIGGIIGSKLASTGGDLLGLELEGVAPEDQEFEVAKQIVRTAGAAVQQAAQSPAADSDPQGVAKAAVVAAARTHLPGLLQSARPGQAQGPRRRSGRWYRRDGKIVLLGV